MFWLKYIVICVVAHEASSKITRVQFFDFLHHEKLQLNVTLADERCTTLPAGGGPRHIVTPKCLMLFSRPNCEGLRFELHVSPGTPLRRIDYQYKLLSLRLCKKHEIDRYNIDNDSKKENYDDLPTKKIQLYSEMGYGGLVLDAAISPYCTTLPEGDFDKVSSLQTEVCVVLYILPHCKSFGLEVSELNTTGLPFYMDDRTKSFRPCTIESILGEPKLTIKMTKFEYHELPETANKQKNQLFTKQTSLINNGTASMKQPFEATWENQEKTVMTWEEMTSEEHEVCVSSEVEIESAVGISELAKAKVTASLTTEYTYKTGKETTKGNEKHLSETKTIKLSEEVMIPACTIYDIRSFAKVTKGYPVKFSTEMEVRGKQAEKQMSAEVVKSKLSEKLTFLYNKDEFTVVARGKGMIVTDFVVDSGVHSDGRKIPVENCERY